MKRTQPDYNLSATCSGTKAENGSLAGAHPFYTSLKQSGNKAGLKSHQSENSIHNSKNRLPPEETTFSKHPIRKKHKNGSKIHLSAEETGQAKRPITKRYFVQRQI